MRVQAQQHGTHLGAQRPARGAMALRALQQAQRLPAVLHQLTTPLRLLRTAAPERDWEEARSEHAVVREVRRAAAEHALLRPGDAVVACVSGGVDSVALLLALSHLAPELSLKLHVLHFNHGLREASMHEEVLVRELAERLGVEFHLRRRGAWPGSGIPAAARHWRRTEALALAAPLRARVATGHHADDQRDTVLLKLLRGAHISRLAGMAPSSEPFVRPLLRCRKAELASYALARGVAWAEDRSNLSAGASRRNAVRLHLVPLLQQLTDGALDARLEDAAHQSAALRALLNAAPRVATSHAAERGFGIPVGGLLDADDEDDDDDDDDDDLLGHEEAAAEEPTPLADAALSSVDNADDENAVFVSGELDTESWLKLPELARLDQLHAFVTAATRRPLSYSATRALANRLAVAAASDSRPRWAADVGAGWRLTRTAGAARMHRLVASEQGSERSRGLRGAVQSGLTITRGAGVMVEHPRGWTVHIEPLSPAECDADAWPAEVDPFAPDAGELAVCEAAQRQGMVLHNVPTHAPLRLRARRDGDRFQPHWRGNPLRLTAFLRCEGVPLHRRDSLPLLQLPGAAEDEVAGVYPAWAAPELRAPGSAAWEGSSVRLFVRVT